MAPDDLPAGLRQAVIRVCGLGKAFAARSERWARLAELMGWREPALRWVLRGIDFEVGAGEAVGIIGVNGAGKSTLLKLLTGVLLPSEGTVSIRGRVAALLELGVGFDPQLTGRQNAYASACIAGRSRAEIDAAIDGIEAFAEIGEHFDAPLRTYSSGMQVRLAFAVATAFRPEVLIVDEALAVGDAYFQHRSFARIRELRAGGTTLLFVSHDPSSVKALCDRAILLDAGGIDTEGAPEAVLERYNALIARKGGDLCGSGPAASAGSAIDEGGEAAAARAPGGSRHGDGAARIESVALLRAGEPCAWAVSGEPAAFEIRYRCERALPELAVGIALRDRTGYDLYGTNTWRLGMEGGLGHEPGRARTIRFALPALALGPGSYSLTVALHGGRDHVQANHDWWDRALVFEVLPRDGGRSIGPLWLPLELEIDR